MTANANLLEISGFDYKLSANGVFLGFILKQNGQYQEQA